MRFLNWMKKPENKSLTERLEALEKSHEELLDQFTRQNETLQEVVLCLKRLAEVDNSMYKVIVAIANIISSDGFGDDHFFSFNNKDKDEYLN